MTWITKIIIYSVLLNFLNGSSFIIFRHIALYDYAWLCMTMYGYNDYKWLNIWICMTMHDYVWLCKTMNDFKWLNMTMDNYRWICMTTYDYL